MTVSRRLPLVLSVALLLVQFSTLINGQCMADEVENVVQMDCFRIGDFSICLPRANILGTIREVSDNCKGTVMTDLSVMDLEKGEICLATAVDCVAATDTGGGNGDGVVFDELQDLIRALISSKTTRRDNGDYGVPKFGGLGSPGGGSSSK